MSTIYTPQAGSLADRVCRFLRINDDEELSQGDIAKKFDVTSNSIVSVLSSAVAAQLMVREKSDSGVYVFRAGPRLATVYPSAAGGAVESTSAVRASAELATRMTGTATTKRPRLPPLDLNAIAVRADVPLPEATRGTPAIKYEALFQKLTEPGHSVTVPITYRKAIAAAAKAYAKRNPGTKFAIRTVSSTETGIWRTA